MAFKRVKSWAYGHDPSPRNWSETANILKEAEKRAKRRDLGFITDPVIHKLTKIIREHEKK